MDLKNEENLVMSLVPGCLKRNNGRSMNMARQVTRKRHGMKGNVSDAGTPKRETFRGGGVDRHCVELSKKE